MGWWFEQTWTNTTWGCFHTSFSFSDHMVLEKILKNTKNISKNQIYPFKRPFVWTNLNPLHAILHCAKFCWNWRSGSGLGVKCKKFTTMSTVNDGQGSGRENLITIERNILMPGACGNHCDLWTVILLWGDELRLVTRPATLTSSLLLISTELRQRHKGDTNIANTMHLWYRTPSYAGSFINTMGCKVE